MENELHDHVCQALLYLIHIVPRLRYLFQRWCLLDDNQKTCIDHHMIQNVVIENNLYKSLRKAFTVWEHIQDTEGAPGFQQDANDYRLDLNIQERITKMLNEFELNICKVEMQKSKLEDIDPKFVHLSISNSNIKDITRAKSPTVVNAKRNTSGNKFDILNCDAALERRKSI